ncbi:BRI1 kinase inhibitor 1-like [Zingiber officinale]|uniref:BRI1 kinase inhibitor 1-like n=1 Tax=Zingiber officinale TaxID=94328 RepID=UPI001C4D75C4|nr:BRI1 kinase inhibitor 1-like [Zingiber officinale]
MEIEDNVTSPPRPPHPLPPSAITSPSHDFSFTISFQTLSSPATLRGSAAKSPSASSGAFDLAPADDIFLHGHLLPLRLLSHPGSPPRDSDISFENFRFPLGHTDSDRNLNFFDSGKAGAKEESRATKPSSSALAAFFGLGKLRRRNEKEGAEAAATTTTKRKRKGIDVIRLLRKYANLVELLFFSRTGERERERRRHEDDDLRRRPCSFSGHSNRNSKAEAAAQGEWRRRKKGQMSAPASMRTSPSNSGLLSASSMTISSTSTSDSSTMEELQSAIQAAIAHCKNSIAVAAKQRAGDT